MRQFSAAARFYISTVICGGVLAILGAWALHRDRSHPWLVLFGCVVAAIATRIKVVLFTQAGRKEGERNRMSMSLQFVPTFLVIYTLGPLAGALVGMCSTPFSKKSPYYRVLFNSATLALSAFAAALVLHPFGFSPGSWDPGSPIQAIKSETTVGPLIGILLATTAYYVVNTVLVVVAISLTTGEKPWVMWKQLLWTGPGYFAGASCAMVILTVAPSIFGSQASATNSHLMKVALLLVAMTVPTVIFFLYKYHAQLDEEKQTRIETLNMNQEVLEQINVELAESKDSLQQLFTSTVESLALAIDAKDRYTKEHIQRVKGIAVAVAHELGMTGDALKAIETGALLHDIGKIAVPEHILTKPGRLTEDEFATIRAHPEMGARILEPVRFPFPVLPIVRHHHERWDGSGYPDGLVGEAIPVGARILAVADVYDALTSDRSYRAGWSHDRAVAYLGDNAGTHFDPVIASAFLEIVTKRPEIFVAKGARVSNVETMTSSVHDAVAAGINRASFEYLALYEVSQAISSTVNLEEMLEILVRKIQDLFEASSCVILLVDEADVPARTLLVRAAVGEQTALAPESRVTIGEGATGTVVSTGVGTIGAFDPTDIAFARTAGEEAPVPLESTVIAPLSIDGRVLGTINLYQTRTTAFDTDDLRVLTAIALQASRALERAMEYDRTLESALTDALTGLHNARHLNQFLERSLKHAKSEERVLSVLVLDLDNFKPVNDKYGHTWGNEVLRDLGGIFQSTLRSADLVARYAGDEFVIVLPGAGVSEARVVIEKIRAAIRTYDASPPGTSESGEVYIEVSAGTASFPEDGREATLLISVADRRMFRDKKKRKGETTLATEITARSLKLIGS